MRQSIWQENVKHVIQHSHEKSVNSMRDAAQIAYFGTGKSSSARTFFISSQTFWRASTV
jgi:hypothetical protein